MTISLLNEIRLNDLHARSPALFSTLPFVPTEQPGDLPLKSGPVVMRAPGRFQDIAV